MNDLDFTGDAFQNALRDYCYLLDRHYPEKETLKLIGDRYRLTGLQRTLLFRGIASQEKALNRKSRLVSLEDLKGKKLYIDGYNVLFSVTNYLLGKAVFIGNDGILRDSGGVYGKIENESVFLRSSRELVNFIAQNHLEGVTIYLDAPVFNSSAHIRQLEKEIQQSGAKAETGLAESVDRRLKQIHDGVIATSDSEIIDETFCPIFDLARCLLLIHSKSLQELRGSPAHKSVRRKMARSAFLGWGCQPLILMV